MNDVYGAVVNGQAVSMTSAMTIKHIFSTKPAISCVIVGDYAAVCYKEGYVDLFKVSSGTTLRQFRNYSVKFISAALSDKTCIITGNNGKTYIYSIMSGSLIDEV